MINKLQKQLWIVCLAFSMQLLGLGFGYGAEPAKTSSKPVTSKSNASATPKTMWERLGLKSRNERLTQELNDITIPQEKMYETSSRADTASINSDFSSTESAKSYEHEINFNQPPKTQSTVRSGLTLENVAKLPAANKAPQTKSTTTGSGYSAYFTTKPKQKAPTEDLNIGSKQRLEHEQAFKNEELANFRAYKAEYGLNKPSSNQSVVNNKPTPQQPTAKAQEMTSNSKEIVAERKTERDDKTTADLNRQKMEQKIEVKRNIAQNQKEFAQRYKDQQLAKAQEKAAQPVKRSFWSTWSAQPAVQ